MSIKKNKSADTPRNPIREQFYQHRKSLIGRIGRLRAEREALKGVKGSGDAWAKLCAQIDEVQAQIDQLTKSLGLEKKGQSETNVIAKPASPLNPFPHPGTPGRLMMLGAATSADKSQCSVNPSIMEVGSYAKVTKPQPVGRTDLNDRNEDPDPEMVEEFKRRGLIPQEKGNE